ncbi:hypothetical protein FOZ62_032126, partial [Perkinsus olseni]
HPRPSSPSAYRRADHIHTVPLSNARLEELSGAMPWEPAMNDFLLLQSQRVPKCRVGDPVDPQGFGPKSTSKRFIRQFGPPSIYKGIEVEPCFVHDFLERRSIVQAGRLDVNTRAAGQSTTEEHLLPFTLARSISLWASLDHQPIDSSSVVVDGLVVGETDATQLADGLVGTVTEPAP